MYSRLRVLQCIILAGLISMAFVGMKVFLVSVVFAGLVYWFMSDKYKLIDDFAIAINGLPITKEEKNSLVSSISMETTVSSTIVTLVAIRTKYPNLEPEINTALDLVEARLPRNSLVRRYFSRKQLTYTWWVLAFFSGLFLIGYAIVASFVGEFHVPSKYGAGADITGPLVYLFSLLSLLMGMFLCLMPFHESYGHSFLKLQRLSWSLESVVAYGVIITGIILALTTLYGLIT